MKYDLSAQFLEVRSPDKTFGDAWRSLCRQLLACELGESGLDVLDRHGSGMDIWHMPQRRVYRCIAHRHGAAGLLDSQKSVESIRSAIGFQGEVGWSSYALATNAGYTRSALREIAEVAGEAGLREKQVENLGPEYWSFLCEKHAASIRDRFNFRVKLTVDHVIEAFRRAKYFDRYLDDFRSKIRRSRFTLLVTNNRTPVELEIPFCPELSVENYLDAAKNLLGIEMERAGFQDLGTSAQPSLSVVIDAKPQAFKRRIKDLQVADGDPLEVWIAVRWREDASPPVVPQSRSTKCGLEQAPASDSRPMDKALRRRLTLSRSEDRIQTMIWDSLRALANGGGPSVTPSVAGSSGNAGSSQMKLSIGFAPSGGHDGS